MAEEGADARDWLPIDLDHFRSNVILLIPVALLPTHSSSKILKNPPMIKDDLKQLMPHFAAISQVKTFGRTVIVCRTSNLNCASYLLNCNSFSCISLMIFFPFHLCCTRGVKGVDSSADATELLDQFKGLRSCLSLPLECNERQPENPN